jgi:hypothetical protein
MGARNPLGSGRCLWTKRAIIAKIRPQQLRCSYATARSDRDLRRDLPLHRVTGPVIHSRPDDVQEGSYLARDRGLHLSAALACRGIDADQEEGVESRWGGLALQEGPAAHYTGVPPPQEERPSARWSSFPPPPEEAQAQVSNAPGRSEHGPMPRVPPRARARCLTRVGLSLKASRTMWL